MKFQDKEKEDNGRYQPLAASRGTIVDARVDVEVGILRNGLRY